MDMIIEFEVGIGKFMPSTKTLFEVYKNYGEDRNFYPPAVYDGFKTGYGILKLKALASCLNRDPIVHEYLAQNFPRVLSILGWDENK
jgi:hypothetical protein